MPRLRFLRPSTELGLEKRGIHPPIWPFIGRFYYLRLFAWLLPALISASLTKREQTAARLLLCALIGYLKEEARMDEQSFPMVMELLKYMEGEKEEGCQDPVDWLLEDANSRAHRHESYYNDYQRYQLMQVDKKRVILSLLETWSVQHK